MFRDTSPDWNYVVPSSPDPTFYTADTEDATLAEFFSRPIKIQEYTWDIAAPFFQTFDPWTAYFTNKRVINRIANFNLLRANMHVKIIINGNAFYYGRLLASYQPFHNDDQFTLNRAFFPQDAVEASQRPHVYIDPTTSQGGTLHLPFVNIYNAMSIPDGGWLDMGVINLRHLQLLKHANGAVDGLTISIFAWADNVKLSIPTSTNPLGLVPQSGDEYALRPISAPAAVVERVAAKLSAIPAIAPYALASQMIASGVGMLARAFGYSRPVVVDSISPMRPTFGNYANVNAPDACNKLTLDMKQETCIDSRVVGLNGDDEMAIRSLTTRETWLTSFSWGTAAAPESQLFTTYVTPITWSKTSSEYHIPAMTFASLPFKWWRGTIKYRFQVVSSNFHKGRIKIVYDPYAFSSNEYNTNYVRVFDISTEKDFTVAVGWGTKRPFLRTLAVEDALPLGLTQPWTTTAAVTLTPMQSYANGTLSVYVVNDLTVPNSTVNNDIEVNVFVSTSDDYEIVEPQNCKIRNYGWVRPPDVLTLQAAPILEPQSGMMTGECDMTTPEDSRPMLEGDGELMAPKVHGTSDIYKVMFGDPVTSVRQLVKRYNLSRIHVFGPVPLANYAWASYIFPDFPPYRGTVAAPEGLDVAGTKNQVMMTILNWYTPGYVCRRGGLRWKTVRSNPSTNAGILAGFMQVKREPCAESASLIAVSGTLAGFQSAAQAFPATWDGAQLQISSNNATLETDHPYYAARRFFFGKVRNHTLNTTNTPFHSAILGSSTGDTALLRYVSGSDDFDLSFFTGAPILYVLGPTA